ncbi:hypothetical protein PybrP1_004290 [[Pythium] brassicae (nom. inval.)]|nr:hypothetical protein PybrP1_004290 [[Pythium] brassicae (nom. inval.)]
MPAAVLEHQRAIVRHFAPHLSDSSLTKQERVYFWFCLVRVALALALPALALSYRRDAIFKTSVLSLLGVVAGVEIARALYRYFVLWPEGLCMRWNYWHEIETAEDCYKLKVLGYYHRKIDKFVGNFPATMSSAQIRSFYRTRGVLPLVLFTGAYVASLWLLARSTAADGAARPWILFALSATSALVVLRYAKMHLIELPQVLALRCHPEFAASTTPLSPETVPFARLVATYHATDEQPVAVAVAVTPSTTAL